MTRKTAEQFVNKIETLSTLVRDYLDPCDRREAIDRLTGKSCFTGQPCCSPGRVRQQLLDWSKESRRVAYLEGLCPRMNA